MVPERKTRERMVRLDRAGQPRIPEPTPIQQRSAQKHQQYMRGREALERASILRGLVLVAVLVMIFSLWHAGLHRAFVPGWWHP
jgi:hypothetical protein